LAYIGRMKTFRLVIVVFFMLVGMNACVLGSATIDQDSMPVALLDELYDEYFDIDSNWNDFFNYDHVFYMTDGNLPAGLEVVESGRLIGIPYELGSFDFEVTVYGVDYDGYTDYLDSAWFTVFVTEPSTNTNCPSPDSETITEVYVCLGDIEEEQVEEGDDLSLDLNYYVRLHSGKTYSIQKMDFTLTYDATNFSVDDETLNSSMLREAATLYDATISVDSSVAGQLQVSIQSGSVKGFRRAGRLMDIPFTALADLSQSNYDFTLEVTEVLPLRETISLPEIIGLDGSLSVEDPIEPAAEGESPSAEGA